MALAPDDISTGPAYSAPGYARPGYSDGAQAVVADDQRTSVLNRASWGAILAGVVVALVIQLVLNILGVGIGLSTLDAGTAANNPDAGNAAIIATAWIVVGGIIASFVGGAAAGRLCGSSRASTARWHGFTSWAVTTLVIVFFLASAIGGAVGGTFSALGGAVSGVGKAAASAVGSAAGAAAGVASPGGGDALTAKIKSLVNPNQQTAIQDDVTGYVRASISGDTKAADASRDKAVNDVAQAANISPEEAKTRIDNLVNSTKATIADAKTQAAAAAEAARKATTQAALYGVLALVLGALAAWLGGGVARPARETSLVVPVAGRTIG